MKSAAEMSLLLPQTATVAWVPGIPFRSSRAALALGNDSAAFLSRRAGGNPAVTEALCGGLWINTVSTVRTEQSRSKSHHIKIFILLRDR